MSPWAYYNENNLWAATLLMSLVEEGVIPVGFVDTRSIKEVQPDDLREFRQVHLFAGGGLWAVAARIAGWPDDRAIWTGSCPCQPFSVAGRRGGDNDERHLWPDMFRLVSALRPALVMGEQVAGKAGYGWFDGVQFDLEEVNYAARAVNVPACAVNAPHIRRRLWWIAKNLDDSDSLAGAERRSRYTGEGEGQRNADPASIDVRLADTLRTGPQERSLNADGRRSL